MALIDQPAVGAGGLQINYGKAVPSQLELVELRVRQHFKTLDDALQARLAASDDKIEMLTQTIKSLAHEFVSNTRAINLLDDNINSLDQRLDGQQVSIEELAEKVNMLIEFTMRPPWWKRLLARLGFGV